MMNSKTIRKIYTACMAIAAIMIAIGIILCLGEHAEELSSAYMRSVTVDMMGMLACGIFLIGLYAGKNDEKQNQSMFRVIFTLSLLFFLDLLSSFFEGNPMNVKAVLAVNTFTFIFEDVLGYAYWTYIRNEIKIKNSFLKIADAVCLIALSFNIVLDVINVKTGVFFTVSPAGEYIDMPYEFMGDIAIMFVFLEVAIAVLFMSELKINEKCVLMSFEIFPFIAYVLGSVTQEYTWVYPAYLLSTMLIYIRIFSEREKKIAEQQVVLTKQSTALMISQIQPHFLYNVLTTISNLCVTDPEEAEETTVLFSQYLRTNLDSLRKQEPVPFATELMHVKTYVELEKKRFGDILNVEYEINEQNFMVPSLGIQPIVENSIKHGIRGKNAPGTVKISTHKVANGYKIVIEDDGIGFDMNAGAKDDGRSHVGMTNVKERLKQMCNASVTIESSLGNGCRTEIIIPE